MRRIAWFLETALLLLACCSGCGADPRRTGPMALQATFETIEISDEALLEAAYSPLVNPFGFYKEHLKGESIYYENTLSVPTKYHGPPFCPLCTDDRSEALEWSEASSKSSAYYRDLVGERETDRYFEFRREFARNSGDVVLSRVHKCSYLDCSGCNPDGATPVIGRLNARPIDEPVVQSLAQYLWFLEHYNLSGAKALASVPRPSSDGVSCAIYHLALQRGDFGLHDRIALLRTVYTVAKSDGKVSQASEALRVVVGRYNENPIPGPAGRPARESSRPVPPSGSSR